MDLLLPRIALCQAKKILLASVLDALGRLGGAKKRPSSPRTTEGACALAEALALVEETEERWCEAELLRLKGELLLSLATPYASEAEACYRLAIAVAQRQGAKMLELRAATSLARLWREQGKCTEAYDLLAPVCGWFTEGFSTSDLNEARLFLQASAQQVSR